MIDAGIFPRQAGVYLASEDRRSKYFVHAATSRELTICVRRQRGDTCESQDAGWSSLVARQAHNLKAAGSNPAPATQIPPWMSAVYRVYVLRTAKTNSNRLDRRCRKSDRSNTMPVDPDGQRERALVTPLASACYPKRSTKTRKLAQTPGRRNRILFNHRPQAKTGS